MSDTTPVVPLPDIALATFYTKMYDLFSTYYENRGALLYKPEYLIGPPVHIESLELRSEELRRMLVRALEDDQALWPLLFSFMPRVVIQQLVMEAIRLGRVCKTSSGKNFYLALLDWLVGYLVATDETNMP